MKILKPGEKKKQKYPPKIPPLVLCGIKPSRGNSEICYNFQNVRIFFIAQIPAAIQEDVSPALQWQRRNVDACDFGNFPKHGSPRYSEGDAFQEEVLCIFRDMTYCAIWRYTEEIVF